MRPLRDAERAAVKAGLRSPAAFTLRRARVLRASARGAAVPQIARALGRAEQTVRNAIHAFAERGVAALTRGSSRPRTAHAASAGDGAERLRELLHRSPRDFGHPTGLWTLGPAATAHAARLTDARVSGETIRATLARLGVRWRRAKAWITSPDPAYARQRGRATA